MTTVEFEETISAPLSVLTDGALLCVAALLLKDANNDMHKAAHMALQLEGELRRARRCIEPAGMYRALDCSVGWIPGGEA